MKISHQKSENADPLSRIGALFTFHISSLVWTPIVYRNDNRLTLPYIVVIVRMVTPVVVDVVRVDDLRVDNRATRRTRKNDFRIVEHGLRNIRYRRLAVRTPETRHPFSPPLVRRSFSVGDLSSSDLRCRNL